MTKTAEEITRKSDDAKGENTAKTHLDKEADQMAKKGQKTEQNTTEPIRSSQSKPVSKEGLLIPRAAFCPPAQSRLLPSMHKPNNPQYHRVSGPGNYACDPANGLHWFLFKVQIRHHLQPEWPEFMCDLYREN